MPDLFKNPKPVTMGSNQLLIVAAILESKEISAIPLIQGLELQIDPSTKIKMYPVFMGYSVLDAILKTDPKDYSKIVFRPCKDFASWIGSVNYDDAFEDLLKVFERTRFGDAMVERSGNLPTIVTLQEIISLYKQNVITSTLHVSEIGTEMVKISPDSSLMDAVRMMFQKGVRRLFLIGGKRDAIFPFISSRSIVRFLFSSSRLGIVRENPERWVEAKVSEIGVTEARIIPDGRIVNQAAREISGVDNCLACESGKVVSRWDIVMKPWKSKNYSFAAE